MKKAEKKMASTTRFERLSRHAIIVGKTAWVLRCLLYEVRRRRDDYIVLMESDEVFSMSDNECVACREAIAGHGNNAAPPVVEGQCCDACRARIVIARMRFLNPHAARAQWF